MNAKEKAESWTRNELECAECDPENYPCPHCGMFKAIYNGWLAGYHSGIRKR